MITGKRLAAVGALVLATAAIAAAPGVAQAAAIGLPGNDPTEGGAGTPSPPPPPPPATPLPVITVGDASVLEGDSGIQSLLFKVSITPVADEVVLFDWIVTAGTATSVVDYGNVSGFNYALGGGVLSREFGIGVFSDTLWEADETLTFTAFNFRTSGGTSLGLASVTATGTILNDDAPPATQAVPEPGSAVLASAALLALGWTRQRARRSIGLRG